MILESHFKLLTCHFISFAENGDVESWGCNRSGQLGLGDLTDRNRAVVLMNNKNLKHICLAEYSSFLLESKTLCF